MCQRDSSKWTLRHIFLNSQKIKKKNIETEENNYLQMTDV